MKIMCALSLTMRLALLAFVAGLAIGLTLGFRGTTSQTPPIPDQSPLAGASPHPGQSVLLLARSVNSVNLHRTLPRQ